MLNIFSLLFNHLESKCRIVGCTVKVRCPFNNFNQGSRQSGTNNLMKKSVEFSTIQDPFNFDGLPKQHLYR